MRILEVLAGAEHGGAETAFVDMCIAMAQAGQDVRVVTRPNGLRVDQLKEHNLTVYELPFSGALDNKTPREIKKIIRNFNPHIVQTWMSRASQKTPNWLHNTKASRYLNVARLGGYYPLKHFKHTDYFVTITPDIKNHLIQNGVSEKKIRHINNFAETETADKPVDRTTLDIPKDAFLLVCLGRLHESKAFDTLMRAVVNLDDVYVWIAGEGPDRKNLESLRDELGLEKRIKFLGWRDDRAALLQTADACVFPSRYEPFGTVFVQAWEQKCPLIVSDAKGPKQFVTHDKDGLVFPIDNINELRDRIKRLKDDQKLAERLVKCGHAHYKEKFTKDVCVQGYIDWYKEILRREEINHA